jgi:hypothetical protein
MSALDLLAQHYDDTEPGVEGTAAYIVTVGEDGWPHAAMVSIGEVVVRADGRCAIALWEGTRTTTNLLRTGQATLLTVLSERAVRATLRLSAVTEPAPVAEPAVPLRCFVGSVEEAVAETAPYARLTNGIRFVLDEPATVLPRWQATRATLRRLLD